MTGGDTNPKRPSTCLYLVLESRGAWWVDREGKSLGPYKTRDEAESGAFHLIEVFVILLDRSKCGVATTPERCACFGRAA